MSYCDKKDGTHCIYCTVPFGATVLFRGKLRILHKEIEHFMPKKVRGIGNRNKGTSNIDRQNITRSCQICNSIKRARDFETGTDAQNYILDKLLQSDWHIVKEPVR